MTSALSMTAATSADVTVANWASADCTVYPHHADTTDHGSEKVVGRAIGTASSSNSSDSGCHRAVDVSQRLRPVRSCKVMRQWAAPRQALLQSLRD